MFFKKSVEVQISDDCYYGDVEVLVNHHHRHGAKEIIVTPHPGSESKVVAPGVPLKYTITAIHEVDGKNK
jgi:hypothetical protein